MRSTVAPSRATAARATPAPSPRAVRSTAASRPARAPRAIVARARPRDRARAPRGLARARAVSDDVPIDATKPKVLVAGGGIAGLVAAAACRRKGMEVRVFEKVKKYEPFGGPIQLQCNAQGALDSIDPAMAEAVTAKGTITGDRVNGLLDGVSGEWFYRFDTRKPCHDNGLPLTLVLSRFELLDILSNGVGAENIEMGTVVER